MNIQGLQKTTLLDYPGHVAATIFLGGCNFRCPFCHNMNVVLCEDSNGYDNNGHDEGSNHIAKTQGAISEDEVLSFLRIRQGILDGICITGGEPTLYKELPDFIKKIKGFGYKVKLDTNGTNFLMLKDLVKNNLVDYVAMDVKTSLSNYDVVAGISGSDYEMMMDNVRNSIDFLISSDVDYEFRTTVMKEYHSEVVIRDIAELLSDAKAYYLQNFVDSEFVPDHELTAFSYDELASFKDILSEKIKRVEIRGVDEK